MLISFVCSRCFFYIEWRGISIFFVEEGISAIHMFEYPTVLHFVEDNLLRREEVAHWCSSALWVVVNMENHLDPSYCGLTFCIFYRGVFMSLVCETESQADKLGLLWYNARFNLVQPFNFTIGVQLILLPVYDLSPDVPIWVLEGVVSGRWVRRCRRDCRWGGLCVFCCATTA